MKSRLVRALIATALPAAVFVSTLQAQKLVTYFNFTGYGTMDPGSVVVDLIGKTKGRLNQTGTTLDSSGLSIARSSLAGSTGVSLEPGSLQSITGDFSIQIWYKNIELGKNGVLFGGTTSSSVDSSFIGDKALMISYNHGRGGTDRVRAITTNDTTFGMDAVLPPARTAIATGTLYDLVLTYAASTRTFTLYIDGEATATGTAATDVDLSSIADYTIGGVSNPAFPDNAASVVINSFLVMDGALTPAQVSELHHHGPAASLVQISAAGVSAISESSGPTVAYYRFENGDSANGAIVDSSPQGNNLSPFRGPAASPEVPVDAVPQTAAQNRGSCHLTGTEHIEGVLGKDASPLVKDFTIEAWVKFDSLKSWQTIVGRDDTGTPGEGIGLAALFYLSKTIDVVPRDRKELTANAFRVELVTSDNTTLTFESYVVAERNVWYHLAVVGNTATDTLTLYVNKQEAGGTSGYNGLFVPSKNTPWTLGRGQYEGKPIDFFRGYLDEVRFSNTALSPDQFLNAPPKR